MGGDTGFQIDLLGAIRRRAPMAIAIAGLVALAPVVRRLPIPTRVAIYVMGCLAAFWMIERGLAVL